MKKQLNKKRKQSPTTLTTQEQQSQTIEIEEGTFSAWLRSGNRHRIHQFLSFVIIYLLVFLTMTWPHLEHAFKIIYKFATEQDYF